MASKMIRTWVRRGSEWRGLEQCRKLSSYPREPLDTPISGLANPNQGSPVRATRTKDFLSECKITRLENGLRVASQEAFGQYSTVGSESMGGNDWYLVTPSLKQQINEFCILQWLWMLDLVTRWTTPAEYPTSFTS